MNIGAMIEDAPLAEEHHHLLAGVDILEGLPQGEVEYVAKHSATVRLGKKESFDPGKGSRSILLLLGGRVRVHEPSAGGKDLTISVVEEGTVVGRTGLTPRRSRVLRVEALEPSVLRVVGWEDFEGLVFRNPEVAVKTISLLSERLAVCEVRLSDQVRKKCRRGWRASCSGSASTRASSPATAVARYRSATPMSSWRAW